ncbi:MAG: pseudouridine-5'-phosphate glycosidase [Myxococcales bacterium]|nr:pseudouridine-5'-phosphate glycosidase [Myxococcales bacterium]
MRLASEISRALERGSPLVALETSVVAQGLPHPENLAAARACEEAVRGKGAIPAMVAVLDGVVRVGLSRSEVSRLAEGGARLLKLGSRDLASALAGRRTGGTTVSATCEIAAGVGIRIFATGGIGGVHRGVEEHLDVSQDLWALSRFPVAVVCAGAKSVLDLTRTLELLESLAVPVVGYCTGELPGFYARETGLPLDERVDGAEEAARLVAARLDELGQGGMLIAVPPPRRSALPRAEVEQMIAASLGVAAKAGVRGKALTPFLLSELARRSEGRTLAANVDLLANNCAVAAEIAVAYARGCRRPSDRRKPRG